MFIFQDVPPFILPEGNFICTFPEDAGHLCYELGGRGMMLISYFSTAQDNNFLFFGLFHKILDKLKLCYKIHLL